MVTLKGHMINALSHLIIIFKIISPCPIEKVVDKKGEK